MITFSSQIFNLSNQHLSVVLLCSSGVDSIAASHYFINKFQDTRSIALLHFNHNLRKQNIEMEYSFERFARTTSVPFYIENLECGDGTEDSCRQARLEYIKSYKDTIFITAHHLDDCVESYLLNCIRGKEGFLPIPFQTEVGTNFINRPFLLSRKQDLLEYTHKHNLLSYIVEDETNIQVRGSRRNLLRNKIIPLLEEERVGLSTIVKKKIMERLNISCT